MGDKAMPERIYVPTDEGNALERLAHSVEYVRADLVQELLDALTFYADPETYVGTVLWGDPPCGAITDDLSEVPSLHTEQGTDWRVGKCARDALAAWPFPAARAIGHA